MDAILILDSVALLLADNGLTAVRLEDGKTLWRRFAEEPPRPALLTSRLLVALTGEIELVDPLTGESQQSLKLPLRTTPVALAASETAIAVGFEDGTVMMLPWLRPGVRGSHPRSGVRPSCT